MALNPKKIVDVTIVDKEFGTGNYRPELGNLCFGNSRGSYPIDRNLTQELFHTFIEICGWSDSYIEFKNDVFELNPYCCFDDVDTSKTKGLLKVDEEDEKRCALPNFIYKPNSVTIKWYKYPMRDAYINKPLTLYEFWLMLDDCIKSVRLQSNQPEAVRSKK
jgi:hypothetical protein